MKIAEITSIIVERPSRSTNATCRLFTGRQAVTQSESWKLAW
jgi:hypothetical protein